VFTLIYLWYLFLSDVYLTEDGFSKIFGHVYMTVGDSAFSGICNLIPLVYKWVTLLFDMTNVINWFIVFQQSSPSESKVRLSTSLAYLPYKKVLEGTTVSELKYKTDRLATKKASFLEVRKDEIMLTSGLRACQMAGQLMTFKPI